MITGVQEKRGFVNGVRGDVMGDVDDARLMIDAQNHPFHAGDEVVAFSEVGE